MDDWIWQVSIIFVQNIRSIECFVCLLSKKKKCYYFEIFWPIRSKLIRIQFSVFCWSGLFFDDWHFWNYNKKNFEIFCFWLSFLLENKVCFCCCWFHSLTLSFCFCFFFSFSPTSVPHYIIIYTVFRLRIIEEKTTTTILEKIQIKLKSINRK